MKAGTFNIHDYLDKLYDVDEAKYNALNEQKAETENGNVEDGIIQQGGENKAYNWLKKEFQKGKTEVKVEMSYHTFKPGYEFEDAPKSTKDFPGMYSDVKNNTSNKSESTASTFPETKFPGMGGESNSGGDSDGENPPSGKTNGSDNLKKDKNESSEGSKDADDDGKGKEQNGIKVEAKTKDDDEKSVKKVSVKTKDGKEKEKDVEDKKKK